MFTPFDTAQLQYHAASPTFGPRINETLPPGQVEAAIAEISAWEGYTPTPMPNLSHLASQIGVKAIHYKDEGPRFGLGSFKALGGAYAVLRVLERELTAREGRKISVDQIRAGQFADQIAAMTITSATDGNHGRSVAWGARRFGAKCRIYIHAEVSAFRAEALQKLGAEVIRVDGDYDASVAQTRTDAEKNGWHIVSDTSWPGYTQPPRDVMAGYGVMAREIVRALPEPPSHVFVQGGVGGLAAGVIAAFHQAWGAQAPRNIIVEPDLAPCLYASARAGKMTVFEIESETIMAGLSCGEPSQIAWDILSETAHGYMTIPDPLVAPTVRMLAAGATGDPSIEAGESAVAGLIALICAARTPALRSALDLSETSSIVILGSEGITDPVVYDQIISGRI